ncbi:MAG: RluA family pseudouridine synthase, partial [Clostridia bacterium]|nr:RluA family pseudouridine synthase [Clostridia bacterium]
MQTVNVIAENADPKRIDAYLAETTELTRTHITLLINEKSVTVNGKAVSKSYKVKKGDNITVNIPDPVTLNVEKENIPLNIVYEDDSVLVVNKPKGMVVHPAAGNQSGTLVNALLYHCEGSLSGINGVERPGIVHRI